MGALFLFFSHLEQITQIIRGFSSREIICKQILLFFFPPYEVTSGICSFIYKILFYWKLYFHISIICCLVDFRGNQSCRSCEQSAKGLLFFWDRVKVYTSHEDCLNRFDFVILHLRNKILTIIITVGVSVMEMCSDLQKCWSVLFFIVVLYIVIDVVWCLEIGLLIITPIEEAFTI